MAALRVLTTAEVPEALLAELRTLMDVAFGAGPSEDHFTDADWDHALGGWHVVVEDAGRVAAHAAVVPRSLDVGGRPVRAGYVEAVATLPEHQGQGLGSSAMDVVTEVLHRHFELGALSSDRYDFYGRAGWERWQGPSYVAEGFRVVRSDDEDDGIMVLRFGPSADVDLTSPITCQARSGDDW